MTAPRKPNRPATVRAPQDHQTKAVELEAQDEEVILDVEWAATGKTYTTYGDNIKPEHMDALARGEFHTFVRALVGEEQWRDFADKPVRLIGKFYTDWSKAAQVPN